MPDSRARSWLSSVRNPDGTWGYVPGQPGRGEPSLLVAAATGQVDLDGLAALDLGWAWWLLPVALRDVAEAAPLRAQGMTAILAHRGVAVENTPGHDGLIPAWAWVEGTAPWVEPTCYAVASLAAEGQGSHPRAVHGRAMIVDRQCPDGGWNYGNREVLGTPLESFPGPTAWAVQVLPEGETVARALARLQQVLLRGSTTSLALGILARAAHGRSLDGWVAPLLARQDADGAFGGGRIDRTALALAALSVADGGPHPFASRVAP